MASRNLFVNIIGVDKASGKFGTIGKAVGLIAGPAVAAGGALFAMGRQFDKARDAIIVGTGASGKALKGLQADFRAVASTTASSFGDVGTAIADVNTRLGLTGKPLRDMSKKMLDLSRITNSDLSTTIANVTRTFGDWSIKTDDQSKAMDVLFDATKRTGIGMDRLTTLVVQFGAPLRQFGFGFEESIALFGKWEKEGVNTQVVLSGMKQALGRFSKAGKEPRKELDRITTAIKGAGTTGKANAIAIAAFGQRAGPDMAAAIREGRFELGDLVAGLKASGGSLDDAVKRTESFGEKWLKLKNKVFLKLEGPATKVFDGISAGMDRLLKAVNPIAAILSNRVIPAMKAIFGWMQRNQGLVKTLAVAIGALVVVTKLHAAALKVQAAGGVLSFITSYLKSIKIVQVATKVWAAAQWLLNAAMAANPITLIILALVALGVALFILWKKSETFRNIVIGTWNALLAAGKMVVGFLVRLWKDTLAPVFSWLYNNIVKPYIGFVIATFKVWWFFANLVIMAIRKLIEKVIAPAVVWLYNRIIKPYIALIIFTIKLWGKIFTWLWRNVIKPVWNFILNGIKFGWNRVLKPVFNAIVSIIRDKVAPAFRKGVDFIKRAWDRLKSVAKKPINFIIGTVVNRGIIGTLNKIAKWLGVKQRLGTIPLLASGGPMPAKPGIFNKPTAIVGEGSSVWPEYVIPTDPKHRKRARGLWEAAGTQLSPDTQLLASGGILGLLKGPANFIRDKLSGPIGRIKEKFGNNFFTRAATALPRKLVGFAIDKVKKWLASWFGGRNLGSSEGGSVAMLMNIARKFQSNARLTSGYRPGDPGWHGRGLAADIIGGGASGMARIARGFYRYSGRLLELIHSGGGGYFVKNGRRVGRGFYGREVANHWDHVHVAARRDALAGVLPRNVFDRGGYLPRGASLAINNTGQPERVVPPGGDDPKAWAREFVKEMKNQGLVGIFHDPDRAIGRRADRFARGGAY